MDADELHHRYCQNTHPYGCDYYMPHGGKSQWEKRAVALVEEAARRGLTPDTLLFWHDTVQRILTAQH